MKLNYTPWAPAIFSKQISKLDGTLIEIIFAISMTMLHVYRGIRIPSLDVANEFVFHYFKTPKTQENIKHGSTYMPM